MGLPPTRFDGASAGDPPAKPDAKREFAPSLLDEANSALASERGWRIIDRELWKELASKVGLPEEARLELVDIVKEEQIRLQWRHAPESPNKIRKKLRKLHQLAGGLAGALHEAGTGVLSAIQIAFSNEEQFKNATLFELSDQLDIEIAALERWRDRLGHAIAIAGPWRAARGGSLRRVVGALDRLLIRHTGKELVRSREETKGRGGRGTACKEFVSAIVRRVLAIEPGWDIRSLFRCAGGHEWHGASRANVRLHRGARPCFGSRRKRGQNDRALGRSRGGFSTKIHLKVDLGGLPLAFHLTGGEAVTAATSRFFSISDPTSRLALLSLIKDTMLKPIAMVHAGAASVRSSRTLNDPRL